MKQRILSAILVLAMVLSMGPAITLQAEAVSTVPSGYTAIYTPEDLDNIRNNLSGKYILMNDIDLTSALASGGSLYDTRGWIAIGYSDGGSNDFTGIIDGNGHKITGFLVTGSSNSASFVYQNKGTLRNLTIQGTSRFNNYYNGVFCKNNYGTVQNCHNLVSINSSIGASGSAYVGGIVGKNYADSVVEYCSNQATIEVSVYRGSSNLSDKIGIAGTIVGFNNGTVQYCYNTGDISVTTNSTCSVYAGGIVGETSSKSVIRNCYNSGTVSAKKTSLTSGSYNVGSGGIIGDGGDVTNYIKYCYNRGTIVCSGSYDSLYSGGLCGYARSLSFTSCYYLNTISKPIYSGAASGASSLNSNQMRTQAAYAGFDFDDVWEMDTYPKLRIKCTHLLSYVSRKEATCAEEGNVAYYYCDICDQCFTSSNKNVTITKAETIIPKSHSFTLESVRIPATCVLEGELTMVCDRCGEEQVQTLPIDSDNHTALVTDGALAPDCTNSGLTEGTHCDACGVYLVEQETVEALGHSYHYHVATTPTATATGLLQGACATCGDQQTVELPLLNEADYTYTVEQEATYLTTGIGRYTWNNTDYGTYYFELVLDKLIMQTDALVTVGTVTGASGEIVELILHMSDAPGLRSLGLSNFVYDNEHMTLIGAEWLVEGALLSNWDAEKGKAAMAYAADTDINGDIFKLTFQIHEDAPEGKYTVSCEATGKIKPDGEDITIAVATAAGVVIVKNYITGDVDDDGVVDTDDAIYLLYYTLFGEADYPIKQPCDFDGDGIVDTDDAIYLLYHTLFGDADYPLH